jgi:UDP-N-acetylglucosamine 1-carboxyvinyltransferase
MDVGARAHTHFAHGSSAQTARTKATQPMDALIIQGGRPLGGHVLRNVPSLADTRTMARVLEQLGAKVEFTDHQCRIDTTHLSSQEAPYDLVRTMRASIYVLGPLVARFGNARVSLPGGCAWGPRPVNLHLEGLDAMGAKLEIDHGYIVAKNAKLRGARIHHEVVSVGATAQIMMAATLADGTTVIEGAALEPDITALGEVLVNCGAHIEGLGTRTVTVHGVKGLQPIDATIIPDRIEAATFMAAAAITGGSITLDQCEPEHLRATSERLTEAGCQVQPGSGQLTITGPVRPGAVTVTTQPYPGFPTDMQAQMMAVCSIADGESVITDTIYLDRFTHVPELARLGADIRLDHNVAKIRGVERLQGAPVMATDIRASAALVIAALVAEGETRISRIYHLDRGYEALEQKLVQLGATVRRVKE